MAGEVIDPLPDDAPQFVKDYYDYYKLREAIMLAVATLTNVNRYSFFIHIYYYLFLLAATQTGSSLITGLLTAITPDRLCGTYGSSR